MRLRQAARWALLPLPVLILTAWPGPLPAQGLFARHAVTVQLATADGKPLDFAEVRVFAPGHPDRPALTGRTDSAGRFEFTADRDGFWSAEARSGSEIARITVRVGAGSGEGAEEAPLSPYWLLGGLLLLLVLAFCFRILRARARRPGSPPRAP